MTDEITPNRDRWTRELAPLAVVAGLLLAPSANAGILYDFSWNFEQYSASGTMVLSDAVGVGASFDRDDVESFELELFNGAMSVGTGSFPPFDGFDTLKGTRNAMDLSMIDLVVSESFGITFGCDAGDCLSGRIFFTSAPNGKVDLGSTQAARDSFMFTELPEPTRASLLAAALAAVAGLRSAKPRSRS